MMKFIASSLEAGKEKARRALGPGATIVSTRELPSGDIEITASDKPAPSAPAPAPKARYAGAAKDAVDEGPFKMAAGARLNESIEHRFSEDALKRLTGALSGAKDARGLDMSDNQVRAFVETLGPHGLGEDLLKALLAGAKASAIDEEISRLEAAFASCFTFAALTFTPTNPIMLCGPTGAGKTSCAAKLAAAASDAGGRALMMTADIGRAGAVEQIRSYSEALGAHYYIVESPLDVKQVLRSQRPSGAVILDTPGVSPYDGGDVAALRSYVDASGAEPTLVLPAGGDAEEYLDWTGAFREIGVKTVIITKFDATKRVGAALRAAYESDLTLSYFSETPFISEGLLAATPEFLARRLIASRPGKIAG